MLDLMKGDIALMSIPLDTNTIQEQSGYNIMIKASTQCPAGLLTHCAMQSANQHCTDIV